MFMFKILPLSLRKNLASRNYCKVLVPRIYVYVAISIQAGVQAREITFAAPARVLGEQPLAGVCSAAAADMLAKP